MQNTAVLQTIELPREVIDEIFIAVVRSRSLRRALRLRLVSRTWNMLIERALFDSGQLDLHNDSTPGTETRSDPGRGPAALPGCDMAFWSRFLTYRTMSTAQPLGPRLRIVRRLAELVVESRQPPDRQQRDEDAEARKASIRLCVSQILIAVLQLEGHHRIMMPRPQPVPGGPMPEDHHLFRRALLVAAAACNAVGLARRLLDADTTLWNDWIPEKLRADSSGQGWLFHLHEFLYNPGCCVVTAYKIAAILGHGDLVRLFLDHTKRVSRSTPASSCAMEMNLRRETLHYAIAGDHRHLFNIVFAEATQAQQDRLSWSAFYSLSTPNLQLFVQFAKVTPARYADMGRVHPQRIVPFLKSWRIATLCQAVEMGHLAVLRYLVEEANVPMDGEEADDEESGQFNRPISKAAYRRRKNCVKYLLEQGALTDRALVAAAEGGSVGIMKIVLQYRGQCDWETMLSQALIWAVRNEDNEMFQLLLDSGAVMNEWDISQAFRWIKVQGCGSMGYMVRSHVIQAWLAAFIDLG